MQSRWMASATVVGLILLGLPAIAGAQRVGSPAQPAARTASATPGSIQGVVREDGGSPISGAMISAVGALTAFAITDSNGRFQLQTLAPGGYVLRAHVSGYVASPPQPIEVRPGGRITSSIALRRASAARPLLVAGLGGAAAPEPSTVEPTEPAGDRPAADDDAHGETVWRIRHGRRGILKDLTLAEGVLAEDEPADKRFAPVSLLERAVASPARYATSLFTDTPFSGQVNILTTGSFETPQQLFSSNTLSRGIAYVRVGAPVGSRADWTVRGALTEADISSWILAGSYTTRAPARHRYDLGWSYSTQRYDGGNPLARRDVTDGSRNAGTVHALDTFAITRAVSVSYGASFARYDYLDQRNLISPRLELTVSPAARTRINAVVSRIAHAPGAEEFLPPGDTGIWLPPQRTFSPFERGQPLHAQRTTHVALELERDLAASTISFRAFRQEVDDQLATLFGAEIPAQPNAKLGHYFVGNAGDASAAGCMAAFRTTIANRVHGSVAYSLSQARLTPAEDLRYLIVVAPSTLRPLGERIHDVSTSIETSVPETSTRLLVLYRISNGFAGPSAAARPGLDSRFDVQVRQSLPFMNFSSAKWEMLLAVRDFFRETSVEQSIYDELLVVRPPKRIVGGVTMHF
jgi:hypothetical protein